MRRFGSPVPTQTVFSSRGSIAIAPIAPTRIVRPDVAPGQAAVGRLPNAAVGAAEIIEIRVCVGARDARDAAAGNRRPDVAPRETRSDGSASAGREQQPQRRR